MADPDSASATSNVLRVHKREELCREVLDRFLALIKTAQSGTAQNPDYQPALDDFFVPMSVCLGAEGSLSIIERSDQLYLNAVRARVATDGFAAQRFLVQTLTTSGFGGLLFEHGVEPHDVTVFLDVLCRPGKPTPGTSGDASALATLINEQGVRRIHLVPRADNAIFGGDEAVDERLHRGAAFFSGETYFKRLFVMKHLLSGVRRQHCVDLREAKQNIQVLVEHLLQDEDAAAALDLIREWELSLFRHSVNVAALAMALARRMGISRPLLGDIGVAALLHDVGKIDRVMTDDPAEPHTASFRRLVSKGGSSRMMQRAALATYEHHRRLAVDNPSGDGQVEIASLPTRIVRVANRFQELVGPTDEDGNGLETSVALKTMRGEVLTALDPGIVAVLESAVFGSKQ